MRKYEKSMRNINISKNLSGSISIVYNKLTTKNDGEAFFSLF